jgi:hypothetical protein
VWIESGSRYPCALSQEQTSVCVESERSPLSVSNQNDCVDTLSVDDVMHLRASNALNYGTSIFILIWRCLGALSAPTYSNSYFNIFLSLSLFLHLLSSALHLLLCNASAASSKASRAIVI